MLLVVIGHLLVFLSYFVRALCAQEGRLRKMTYLLKELSLTVVYIFLFVFIFVLFYLFVDFALNIKPTKQKPE